ncbi:hypothetical protein WG66_014641 [Moniliophthora roreri]|uniref:DRBM domain-containing protein n=1 Tax=Moniliophthora roreri TaxID=221103 RepID=A0A0W0G1L9_MONRR|nr:hypothetical protein WG66_014641 [Moniliophthora roreri]
MKFDSTRIWAKLKRRKFILFIIGVVVAVFTVATGIVDDKIGKILTVIGGLLAILGAYFTFRDQRRNNKEQELLPLTHPYGAELPGQASASLSDSNQSPSDSDESYPLLSEDSNSTVISDVNVLSQEETSPRITASESQETLVSYSGERSPRPYAMTSNSLHSPTKQKQVFNNALEHLNHWCQSNGRRVTWMSNFTGPHHQSEWESIVEVDEIRSVRRGFQKQESRQNAAAELLRAVGAE